MRFAVLGPLEITDDHGARVPVTRRLHRAMLATLLLRAGQPCSQAELAAAIWGDDPPQRPDLSLRTCVYGLRRLLPDPARLRTHPCGYLIDVAPGELDLAEFRDLASLGRQALDDGDPAGAADALGRALSLWREPALADLPDHAARERLIGHRRDALEALIDARLALGLHRQVLPELRGIVAAEPPREHAWAQLMLALYRCGARAEALAAFGRLRMTLVRAYGIEPGPELQDLHQRVLADDPALLIPAAGGGEAGAGPGRQPRPCQLPPTLPDFTGRTAELALVRARLTAAVRSAAVPVTVLTGMPGAGKTALAVHAAHQARPDFPDGQLYACMDADGQARDPHAVLAEFLRALGVPPAEMPPGRPEREALYRSVLAGRRVLVVADGARAAAQVRPLVPGTPGSAVLVTSRARLAGLDGARLVDVGALAPEDSVRLLTTLGSRAAGEEAGEPAEPAGPAAASPGHRPPGGDWAAAAMAVAQACGHLPLALRIAGTRLADEPGLTPAALAASLADEDRCLAELASGEASVGARIAQAAGSAGDAARRALALLAVAGPGDLPESLAATMFDGPGGRAAIRALIDAGLLSRVAGEPAGSGRSRVSYRMHPLVRAYARLVLAAAEPGPTGWATGRLLASGWLSLARARDGRAVRWPPDEPSIARRP